MTKKLLLFLALAAIIISSGPVARADMLKGWTIITEHANLINANGDNVKKDVYISPFRITSTDKENDFLAFCGDFNVSVPWDFATRAVEYNPISFEDSPYSPEQQAQITDLFRHAFQPSFGFEATVGMDFENDTINSVFAQAFQLALWSIIYETEDYDIMKGTFKLLSAYNQEVVNTTNSWLQAVLGNISWDSIGLSTQIEHTITVYIPANGVSSQALITAVAKPVVAVVPEPATIAIFGFGLTGLGLVRARRRV